jgi:hypothetical protein
MKLNTAALLWAAAVVRNRRHVSNRIDPNAKRTQRTNRRFTARTRTLDFNIEVLDALLDRSATSNF